MREALAAADHDYILAEPAARPKRTRSKAPTTKRRGSGRRKVQTQRYLAVIASALCVAAIAGIAINALTLQKRHHPAPLFARRAPASALNEPAVVESLPAPLPVPAPRPQPSAAAAPQPNESLPEKAHLEPPVEKPANGHPRQASGAQSAEAVEARPLDPISQLLQANAHEPQGASARPSATVLAAQRALVKLGFVLKADGVAGATTRQAIERYERDHGRPAHGELTPALLRQLSADAGIPIN